MSIIGILFAGISSVLTGALSKWLFDYSDKEVWAVSLIIYFLSLILFSI